MVSEEGRLRQLMGPAKKNVEVHLKAGKSTFEEEVSPEEVDLHIDDLKFRIEKSDTSLQKYKNIREELSKEAVKEEGTWHRFCDEDDAHYELVEEMENSIIRLKSKLRKLEYDKAKKLEKGQTRVENETLERRIMEQAEQIKQLKTEMENQGTSADGKEFTVKLPKLEIKQFDGNILNYASFWDSFQSAIGKHTKLKPVDKLSYLLAKCQGEAAELLSGLSLTNDNYDVAVGLLDSRFGDEELQISAHNQALRRIPCAKNNFQSIRSTYDQITKHLRYLELKGENMDS